MAKRQKRDLKNKNYVELGQVLASWRTKSYSSSLALFREKQFSFSYSTYAGFELGQNIPSVAQVMELAAAFGESPHDALLTWARVQMPSPELKALFRSRKAGLKREKQVQSLPALDAVWVLNPRELEHVANYPWLTELFRNLCRLHPQELLWTRVDLHGFPQKKFIKTCLGLLVDNGYLRVSERGLSLMHPSIHIPNNSAGNKIRVNSLKGALSEITDKLEGGDPEKAILFQAHISRGFSEPQAKRWQERLEQLQDEFLALPYTEEPDSEDKAHTVVVLFARRSGG
jgi:hypothetical protein